METAAAEKICSCFFYLQAAIDDEATDSAPVLWRIFFA